ncbi:hypothetical protein ACFRAO_23935 [Streptomyces sp. NPDC056656]|uniref:hypothetical protein n=1 Tax=Streptomyces sp. NPDC056656 TaxID=3345895 RepID=UPI0036B72EBE
MEASVAQLPSEGRLFGWHDLPMLSRSENSMGDVAEFVARWEASVPSRQRYTFLTGPEGNRSCRGLPQEPRAEVITPADQVVVDGSPADWSGALEDGVRDLTLTVMHCFSCVTYSSCQGHDYRRLGQPSRSREVCAVARTGTEADRLVRAMDECLRRAAPPTGAVFPQLVREWLRSRADGSTWKSVTLRFVRSNDADWSAYFAEVDDVTASVIRLFAEGRVDDERNE